MIQIGRGYGNPQDDQSKATSRGGPFAVGAPFSGVASPKLLLTGRLPQGVFCCSKGER